MQADEKTDHPSSRAFHGPSVFLGRRRPNQEPISVAVNTPKGRQARFQTTNCVIDGSPPAETFPKFGPSQIMYVKPNTPNAIVQARTGRTECREYATNPEQSIADDHSVPDQMKFPYARKGLSSNVTNKTQAAKVNTQAQTPVTNVRMICGFSTPLPSVCSFAVDDGAYGFIAEMTYKEVRDCPVRRTRSYAVGPGFLPSRALSPVPSPMRDGRQDTLSLVSPQRGQAGNKAPYHRLPPVGKFEAFVVAASRGATAQTESHRSHSKSSVPEAGAMADPVAP